MKYFTDYREKWIESTISTHMDIVCKIILKYLKKIDTILLVGGFGRGEGTIKIVGERALIPLKDYDLVVVTNSNISEKKYIKMVYDIHNALKIPSNWYQGASPGEFHINIKLVKKQSLARLPPDISNYEIKDGSKILYGLDVRKLITLTKKDVGYPSGLRVLLNKVIGLLEYFPENPKKYQKNSILKESMIYECGKTYIEIATALTILIGCYEPNYKKRAYNFENNFEKKLPPLSKIIPDLSKKIIFFTKLKLRPNFDEVNLNPIELWYSTAKDLLKVILFYYETITREVVNNPLILIKHFLKFLELNYYFPYLDFYFGKYIRKNRSIIYLASYLIHIYENVRYLRNISIQKHFFPLKTLFSKRSPIIKIYCVALSTLLSIQETNYKKELIDKGWNLLKQVYPLNNQKKDSDYRFNSLRKACVDAFKIYQIKKIKKSTF